MRGAIVYRPVRTVDDLQDGEEVQVLRDKWWRVNMAGELAFYEGRNFSAPQCNRNRFVVDRPEQLDGDHVEQIPVTFIPVVRDL